jgi:hypothetical protein
LWGDSPAPPNPARLLADESPGWQIGPDIQYQAEPMGGLLAVFAALYEDRVRAVAVRRGLAAFSTALEDAFLYLPADVVIPGALEAGDIGEVAAALAPRPTLLEGMVDCRNVPVPHSDLRKRFAGIYKAFEMTRPAALLVRTEEASPGLAEWLAAQL